MTNRASDLADRAGNYASETLHDVGGRLSDVGAQVRDRAENTKAAAADAYDRASGKIGDAYGAARQRASGAVKTAGNEIVDSPLIALAGGIALGAIVATLLPRTEQEDRLLGPIGGRITDLTRAAANATRDAGVAKLAEAGLTKEAIKEQASKLLTPDPAPVTVPTSQTEGTNGNFG